MHPFLEENIEINFDHSINKRKIKMLSVIPFGKKICKSNCDNQDFIKIFNSTLKLNYQT